MTGYQRAVLTLLVGIWGTGIVTAAAIAYLALQVYDLSTALDACSF